MAASPLQHAMYDLEKLRGGSAGCRGAFVRPGDAPSISPLLDSPPQQGASLPLGIASIDEALPDRGLPRGAVVEVCSPGGLGRATRFALAACASAQRCTFQRNDSQPAWCAWVDPSGTLYAPGVARAGVDLDRLFVVRPEPADIARVAVRLGASQVFSVIVIDRCGVPGAAIPSSFSSSQLASQFPAKRGAIRWHLAVRRLALAVEGSDTTILLLSSEQQAQASLPTAMRIALRRPSLEQIHLRIVKERRGRLSGALSIPLLDLDSVPNPLWGPAPSSGSHETHRRHRVA